MIDFSRNHFELFGLPVRFAIDVDALEHRFRELQRDVHPDRFVAAADAEQRLALQASARVNEAYRTLKDPVGRAELLLALNGVDDGAGTRQVLSTEFLERQLERREAAEQAMSAGAIDDLDALLLAVRADQRDAELALAARCDGDADWRAARRHLHELMFLRKLAADLDAMLGELEA